MAEVHEIASGIYRINIPDEMVKSSDMRALLPHVTVPTLVIGHEPDLERGQELAANIPGARLVLKMGRVTSFVLENSRQANRGNPRSSG